MFHINPQLTAYFNSKYIQKIYGKNIEFADANKSLWRRDEMFQDEFYGPASGSRMKLDFAHFIISTF